MAVASLVWLVSSRPRWPSGSRHPRRTVVVALPPRGSAVSAALRQAGCASRHGRADVARAHRRGNAATSCSRISNPGSTRIARVTTRRRSRADRARQRAIPARSRSCSIRACRGCSSTIYAGAHRRIDAAEAVGDRTFASDVSWYRAVAEQRSGTMPRRARDSNAICRDAPGPMRACLHALEQLATGSCDSCDNRPQRCDPGTRAVGALSQSCWSQCVPTSVSHVGLIQQPPAVPENASVDELLSIAERCSIETRATRRFRSTNGARHAPQQLSLEPQQARARYGIGACPLLPHAIRRRTRARAQGRRDLRASRDTRRYRASNNFLSAVEELSGQRRGHWPTATRAVAAYESSQRSRRPGARDAATAACRRRSSRQQRPSTRAPPPMPAPPATSRSRRSILHSLGDHLFNDNQFEEALDMLLRAESLLLGTPDILELGTVYNSIGRVYRAHGRFDEALRFQLKALALHEKGRLSVRADAEPQRGRHGVRADRRGAKRRAATTNVRWRSPRSRARSAFRICCGRISR